MIGFALNLEFDKRLIVCYNSFMVSSEALQAGSRVAVDMAPNRPYTVLGLGKNRVTVSDGLTKKKHLHKRNVLPWDTVSPLTNKATIKFSALPLLQSENDAIKRAEVEEMIRDYVGSAEQLKDMDLRVELFENGVPLEIAAASAPYSETDIKHIYSGGPAKEYPNGGPIGGTVKVELMVGTSKPIEEIVRREKNIDQSPHVLVQWWNHEYSALGNQPRIGRIEIEQIAPGKYIQRTYKSVSGMGEFNGDLESIFLYFDGEEFSSGTYPGRKSFKIDQWSKTKYRQNPWRYFGFNLSGTTLLNGVEQLLTFHKSEMKKVK